MHPDDHDRIPEAHDADHLDAWLDAFVAGPSTPTTSEPATPDLAAALSAARQVHELAQVAATAHRPPPASVSTQWEEILMAHHATTAPTPLAAPRPLAPNPRTRSRRMETINRLVSIAAILAILIAGAGTAWQNRGHLGFGGGGGGDEPHSYLAAITLPSGQEVNITYAVPTKDDCTVTPLTVDQVMTKLQTYGRPVNRKGPSPAEAAATGTPAANLAATPASDPSITIVGHYDEKTFGDLKATQQQWLACALYGSPFQRWALESNEMVQREFQMAYMPIIDLEAIKTDLTTLASGQDIGRFHAPALTANGYLPMVIEADPVGGYNNVLHPDGSADLSILWMRADGQRLQPFGATADDPSLQAYINASRLEQSLPNTWTFRQDEATGAWLLDRFTLALG